MDRVLAEETDLTSFRLGYGVVCVGEVQHSMRGNPL
jgi:hypothetical protein